MVLEREGGGEVGECSITREEGGGHTVSSGLYHCIPRFSLAQ